MRVVLVATTDVGARTFYEGWARTLNRAGYDVSLVCPNTARSANFALKEGLEFHPIEFKREPRIVHDVVCMYRLVAMLRILKPSVVVTGSPKASLLSVIAARLLGVQAIYTVHGLRYQGASGIRRSVLKLYERLTCSVAGKVVCVGHQIRTELLYDGLVTESKALVLGAGSANGVVVDIGRSECRRDSPDLDLSGERFRVGFVGRLTRDKGVAELAAAWRTLAHESSNFELVIAGDVESDLNGSDTIAFLASEPTVRFLGYQENLDDVYGSLDVLVLPSYREGLPTVVLEAAVWGVPAIVADSTGTCEPVMDSVTGVHVRTRSTDDLVNAIRRLESDRRKAGGMGRVAKIHVRENFDRDLVHSLWLGLIRDVTGAALPRTQS